MIDTAKYKDCRFSPMFNCADFAYMVAKDNGIIYPIGGVNHESTNDVVEAIADNRSLFERVDTPRPLDLVYMREDDGRRHIGLYLKYGKIYHLKRSGSPIVQKITAEIKGRIIGFYRLRSDNA